MGCGKAQGFLARKNVPVKERVSANREKLGRADALKLVRQVARVVVAKGQRVETSDMHKNPPGDEELLKALLGPTGYLRAPTLKVGDTLLVGFHERTYADYL